MNQIGQYTLLEKLGSSVLGAVYRARDTGTGATVALKVLQLGLLDDVSSRDMDARLHREFDAVGRLIHPGIARVFEIRREGNTALIAEELVDGPSITEFASAQGGLDVSRAVTAVVQILEALEFAHSQSVIHQDLKPSNILVSHGAHVRITDFGMARIAARNRDDTGMLVGAMEYMAPEQFLSRPVDERCDIHAVGTILYELLTGKSPFADEHNFAMPKVLNFTPPPPSSVKAGLTPVFDGVIARALAKSPAARFATARRFRDELCAAYFEERELTSPGADLAGSGREGRTSPPPAAELNSPGQQPATAPSAEPAARFSVPPAPGTAPVVTAPPVAPEPATEPAESPQAAAPGGVRTASTGPGVRRAPRPDPGFPTDPGSEAPWDRGVLPAPPPVPPAALGYEPPTPPPLTILSAPPAAEPRRPVTEPISAPGAGPRWDPMLRRPIPPAAAAAAPLTDASIALGGRVLARFVGPIAMVLSRKAAQDAQDERGYFERLAAHLSDPSERTQFLQDVGRRAQ